MKQTLSQRLLKMQAEKDKAIRKFENNEEKTHDELKGQIRLQVREYISNLEAKISKAESRLEDKLQKEDEKFEQLKKNFQENWRPVDEEVQRLEEEMDLFSLKNNIKPTTELGWTDKQWQERAEFQETKMLKLAAIHQFVVEARNAYSRKKNKYDALVKVVCFNRLFEEKCKDNFIFGWNECLFIEKVPTVEAGKAALQKNYDKAIKKFVEFHDEIVAKMENIQLDPAKEFDFRLAHMNNARKRITKKTKTSLEVEIDEIGNYKTRVKLTHLGGLQFNVKVSRAPVEDRDNSKMSDEDLAAELLRYYHPLGLNRSQVKLQVEKFKHA